MNTVLYIPYLSSGKKKVILLNAWSAAEPFEYDDGSQGVRVYYTVKEGNKFITIPMPFEIFMQYLQDCHDKPYADFSNPEEIAKRYESKRPDPRAPGAQETPKP